MAGENSLKPTHQQVAEFIGTADPRKQEDSRLLLQYMEQWTGCEARMWGAGIIGFGQYHYKYASGHEGDAPLIGFSPRKSAFSLYVFTGLEEHEHLIKDLGKFTMGKACIYVKKLSDIRLEELKNLCLGSIGYLRKTYTVVEG
jgi:hypothetical protein